MKKATKQTITIKKESHHSDEFKEKLIHRFHRIEGQIKGIEKMIENNTYCDDILNQINAVQAAISAAALKLLEGHMNTCVRQQLLANSTEVIDELMRTLKKYMK